MAMEQPKTQPERWVEERLHKFWRARLLVREVVFESKTEHQDLIIFENDNFGRVLMLDNIIQLTSRDEFIYHEMMAHVPLFALSNPKHVLIIGGGDGGVLREVLLHAGVEKATLCEIDRSVIDLCTAHFPDVSAGAFSDSRTEIVITDGAAFVANTGTMYDAILVDSTDPVGPGVSLFTSEFYADCKRKLKPSGVLVTQQGLPFFQPWEITDSVHTLRKLFSHATAYLPVTASYLGGHFALGWATDDAGLMRDLPYLKNRFAASAMKTKYYTPEIHLAAFVKPAYIGEMIQ